MNIFSKSKTKSDLILVFHIGSAAVGGTLFRAQASGIPKIIFSVSEPIPIEKKVQVDRFLALTIQTLETVAKKIYEARLDAPAKIFCALSAPWHISQTRVISLKKNTPFVFTAKLADELTQKEIKLFEEEQREKNAGDDSLRPIEFKNIKTMLNGYETAKPLRQKAKELQMTIFISMSGERILKKIEDAVRKHFHFDTLKFFSFAVASFTVARDLRLRQENFLLIDIGGEVTDIFMIKKNVLQESISFPLGHNFLTRGIANHLRCTLSEADSLFSLFKDGHAEEKVNKKLAPVADRLKADWLKVFQESLSGLSHDISIPAAIYLVIDKNWADFFSETIKNEQFNQYILTESKFEVIFLNTQMLHGIANFEESVVREPPLIIDSNYINRFLLHYPAMAGQV